MPEDPQTSEAHPSVPWASDGLDLFSLVIFLAVIELGSVSKAAARHGMSQPSATTRLAKLESKLGVALLERGASGSLPTAAGQQVALWAAEVVASANLLMDGAASLGVERSLSLRIACTPAVASRRLVGWLGEAGLADAELSVFEADTRRVATMVRDGVADVGLVAGPFAPLGLRSEVIAVEDLAVVVAPGHPWASRRDPVGADELATTRLVLPAPGSGTLDIVEAALSEHGFVLSDGHVTAESDAAVCASVVTGAGVGLVPRMSIAENLDSGWIVEVAVASVIQLDKPIRVAWRGSQPPAAAASFISSLMKESS